MGLSNCQCLIVASRNHRNNVEFIQVVLSGVSEDVCAGFILDDHQLDRLPRAVAEDQARRKHLLFPDKPRQRAESAYAHPPVIDRILARSSATPLVPSVVCLIGLSLSMKTIVKNLRVQSYLVAFLRLLHCRRSCREI